jgi:hypothetical protein
VRLDDLIDLYRGVFAQLLSHVDAKASPYSMYYIAVSTPHPRKDIMAASGDVLV